MFGSNGSFAIMPSSFDGKEVEYFATLEAKDRKYLNELAVLFSHDTQRLEVYAGRVIVIGDAAHAIPPTGGQGAAMAFEDAETLSYVLGRIRDICLIRPNGDHRSLVNEMLHKWQRHRQGRIVKVMDFTSMQVLHHLPDVVCV
ncbi:hypothetical protein FOXG_22191 [Fusarium oxysporum f. sp. lycopersici 4287]|uniref:FAD-binding domain-containing protein n=1 Tax=Fusarium oxysporum f. sp. lycopersici (strain 4287 / CBS 123668 / FGSC 9935 / NRRL 34936) TaxID=426428 RepID=A0A0J9W6K0_FUSO4|nr:uncharacterized protein FOXG_22191 [Fusarium oxysporum f. sp. lycopersici 4287]KNB18331.1 hypothetical protein FOXG_22191 [Fusarium oxysporum f. sp. lycopersici 4287]